MAFLPDPFAQAAAEVANKSMGQQIAHSQIFHSARSAFSSKGSGASKGIGLVIGVGKLFLALIPVPIVGAVVGAAVDAVQGKVRGKLHERHLEGNNVSVEDQVKFGIKELTVENLDRYRWKVKDSFDALNAGISHYNMANQNCDDMYQFALLYEQVERRKKKLKEELGKFKTVIENVDRWIADLEQVQGAQMVLIKDKIGDKTRTEIADLQTLNSANANDRPKIATYQATHAGCKLWCYCKKQAKYDPNTNWETVKTYAGTVSNFLKPIAVASIAVRGSDYTSNSDNSKFTT
jgi:hypothetical protein